MAGHIYSIGHSNRSLEDFIKLLKEHDIDLVVDLRTHPFSRWMPHFNREKLMASLDDEHIGYLYFGDRLGGRPEGGLEAFLASKRFTESVTDLLFIINGESVALMCAEMEQDKCHRKFIVEEISRRGNKVKEIGNSKSACF